MVKLATIQKSLVKEFGEHTIKMGSNYEDVARCSTGVFEFDYATNGGFPRGRITELYGLESSCKTNLAYKAIAVNQINRPKETNVFVNLEDAWDPEWAAKLGVDVDKVILLEPDFAEQAVDMVQAVLYAEDLGILVMDSLSALITENEVKSSASKAIVGGSGLVVGKLIRKTVKALQAAAQDGRDPCVIAINQVRVKVGVMFGDPETTSGGNAPKFAASLRVRLYGKNVMDTTHNKEMPVKKNVSAIVKKYKVPVNALKANFDMVMIAHKGLVVGESDSWLTVKGMLEEHEVLKNNGAGKGWTMFGQDYKNGIVCKEKFYSDADFREDVINFLAHGVFPETIIPDSTGEGDTSGVTINV